MNVNLYDYYSTNNKYNTLRRYYSHTVPSKITKIRLGGWGKTKQIFINF